MEPVVIVVKEIKNGKISLTEDELKEIVLRAYNDGYCEGKKNNWYGSITYTNTTPPPTPLYTTTCNNTPEKYNNITITCSDDNQFDLFNEIIGDFMND